MELIPQTTDLLKAAITSWAVVFVVMLLLNGISQLVIKFFSSGD